MRGRGARRAQRADDHEQKCAVAAASGWAGATAGQVTTDRRGLFRSKLVVQIFPQPVNDLTTFHSLSCLPRASADRPRVRPVEQRPRAGGSSPMSPRARNATILVIVGFVAYLLWSTL